MELPAPSPTTSFLAVVLAAALFLVSILRLRGRAARNYNLPPGPRPWPVIGNLDLLGPLPHHSAHNLSARHGLLMSLRLGSFPAVVASSPDMARFFLKTRDLAFVDRLRTAAGKYISYNYSGLFSSPYGASWRQGRKLWQAELFNARRLASLEHVRGEEVSSMLSDLRAAAAAVAAGGGRAEAVALREHLFMVNLNVISRMVLGRKFIVDGAGSPFTPEEFRWMIDEIFFLHGVLNVGDVIPWLGWLDPQGYVKRMKRLAKMVDRFLEQVLDEHNERRRREGEGFLARDMVDVLLELADDPNLEVPIHRDCVKGFTHDLIDGGTDTSAVTVEWALSELLRNPDVLAKATEELDRVIGRGRLVVEEDMPNVQSPTPNLPYVEAVVKETMRLQPVAPLLTPRLSREDVSVGGYDIPVGTRILINIWAIGRDPAVWEAPMEFRPEWFVGGGGGVDVKGQDFELLPFGSGRRMCPGIGLGLKMVHMILANLLHAFAWRLPDGVAAEELSMEETFGLTVPRRVPLEAVAEPKLPAHLYAVP
ncbi:trimethyltridecatetraene synthase-like [Panicum virgatum]|uniref:trimethyltridecatetraene synthase-like n=1 Tax=Panicum virgatum TaxID=38727 RepID=UPI0019D609BE|nr:trimethyltridecatetraene synthase-like [Panicum virgatum]